MPANEVEFYWPQIWYVSQISPSGLYDVNMADM